ncbi:DUF3142 domain-containing protein [Lichenibacterium minor]|uniref:DUF3142 domain-containing protein n=1 Tax=Lichenibacterium minor TaxID=2316528 RepID=UPI001FDFDE65|nr:DUF3142 domain-containing protein [Lichenibacterium minor]
MRGAARAAAALAVAACSAAASPGAGPPAAPEIVEAGRYRAFWLWAGVRPQPALAGAEAVYLLQGEVEDGPVVRLASRRAAIPHVRGSDVWLVVRAATLAWPPAVYAQVLRALADWRAAGDRVVGVQIDFDARTRGLAGYAAFLKDLRGRLPADCRLGITGLLDWSANGDPAGLAALAGTVDEVVLQIYQGRHVIPGYAAYLGTLGRMTVPFRIGLLQGAEWRPPEGLERRPLFRGYVVFLRNG